GVLATTASARTPFPPKAAHRSGAAQVFATRGAHRLLYDQNDVAQGIAVVSQNFEHIYDTFDAQAADDFAVPSGERWTVKEVDVTGQYMEGAGPPNSENVFFYTSALGRPGGVVHSFHDLVGAENGGAFAIDLGRGVKLGPGHYWVSVQVNMRYDHRG